MRSGGVSRTSKRLKSLPQPSFQKSSPQGRRVRRRVALRCPEVPGKCLLKFLSALQPCHVLEAHGAGGAGHEGKHAKGRELGHALRNPRHGSVEGIERLQKALFVLNADERRPHGYTEHDHRGDGVVGQRVEGVGRNEQREEIELFMLLDQFSGLTLDYW